MNILLICCALFLFIDNHHLNSLVEEYFVNCASSKCSGLDDDYSPPASGKEVILSRIIKSLADMSSDCVRTTFMHVGRAGSGFPSPATAFPVTLFPLFEDPDDRMLQKKNAAAEFRTL